MPYAASKYALEGATEALRHEVDRWQVKVSLVHAGMYATGIFDAVYGSKAGLPADYPLDSPYRPLIEHNVRGTQARVGEAFDPKSIGDLLVAIAASDGSRLRWPADAVAERVLETVFAHDDRRRDEFLREVAGSDWWSHGDDQPAGND